MMMNECLRKELISYFQIKYLLAEECELSVSKVASNSLGKLQWTNNEIPELKTPTDRWKNCFINSKTMKKSWQTASK